MEYHVGRDLRSPSSRARRLAPGPHFPLRSSLEEPGRWHLGAAVESAVADFPKWACWRPPVSDALGIDRPASSRNQPTSNQCRRLAQVGSRLASGPPRGEFLFIDVHYDQGGTVAHLGNGSCHFRCPNIDFSPSICRPSPSPPAARTCCRVVRVLFPIRTNR